MFRISRRLDYGLQLMIALANDADNKPQSTASLAEKLQIPLPFLHQIGHMLMQAGMIKASPGPHGGVRLNRPAGTITILQIVEILEGPVSFHPSPTATKTAPSRPALPSSPGMTSRKCLRHLDGVELNSLAATAQKLPIYAMPVSDAQSSDVPLG